MTSCDGITDEQVMMRVGRERELFSCIIGRYEQALRRYLRRIMPGLGEDADDVLQDVFIKVYVNANDFDPSLSFSSWVYRIAHNEAVSWLRKKKARPELVDLGDDDCATFLTSMEVAAESRESHLKNDEVSRVLAAMSERYRTILVLRFLEGKNYEEMSDILELPGGTVATHLFRAKKEFISKYREHGRS